MPQFSLSSWGLRNDRFDYSRTFSGVWVSNTWCHSSWCRASLSIMFPSLSFISTIMYQSYRRYRRIQDTKMTGLLIKWVKDLYSFISITCLGLCDECFSFIGWNLKSIKIGSAKILRKLITILSLNLFINEIMNYYVAFSSGEIHQIKNFKSTHSFFLSHICLSSLFFLFYRLLTLWIKVIIRQNIKLSKMKYKVNIKKQLINICLLIIRQQFFQKWISLLWQI